MKAGKRTAPSPRRRSKADIDGALERIHKTRPLQQCNNWLCVILLFFYRDFPRLCVVHTQWCVPSAILGIPFRCLLLLPGTGLVGQSGSTQNPIGGRPMHDTMPRTFRLGTSTHDASGPMWATSSVGDTRYAENMEGVRAVSKRTTPLSHILQFRLQRTVSAHRCVCLPFPARI